MATSIQQNIHTFLDDIRRIIDAARTNAVRSVDFAGYRCTGRWDNAFSKKNSRVKTVPIMAATLSKT